MITDDRILSGNTSFVVTKSEIYSPRSVGVETEEVNISFKIGILNIAEKQSNFGILVDHIMH